MELFGKAAWAALIAGAALLPLVGCSHSPDGEYAAYDKLKESSRSLPEGSKTTETAATKPSKLTHGEASTPDANGAHAPVKITDTRVNQKTTSSKVAIANTTPLPKPPQVPGPEVKLPGPTASNTATSRVAAGSANPAATKPTSSGAPIKNAASPRKVQVLVASRNFRPEGSEGAWRVSYDDIDLLKVLNMDPVTPNAASLMPPWLKNLDGHRIRIRGFMYPTFQQSGIRAFALARDNQICCFGRNPKIYDVFDVLLRQGVTTDYIPNRPFDVVGVFHIRPDVQNGELYHLYDMDDATVVVK